MMVVSACLAGKKCTYKGTSNTCAKVVELVKVGRAIAVCPEELAGLPTPRPPAEIRDGRVVREDGTDITEQLRKGVEGALNIAIGAGCTHAIVKSRSPSCGSGKIYDGTFSKKVIKGDGVFTALLKKKGINVRTEEEL